MKYLNILVIDIRGFYLSEGCARGKTCSDGRLCGNVNVCTNCSFDDCAKFARAKNSFAFSYRGTSETYCRLCTEEQFNNAVSVEKYAKDYGLYSKRKYIFVYIYPTSISLYYSFLFGLYFCDVLFQMVA